MDADAIVRWIQDRLNDEERDAQAAAPGPWEYQDVESIGGGRICDPTVAIAHIRWDPARVHPWIRRSVRKGEADATGRYIARRDPARALREVAAKRRRLERHQPWGGNGSPARCSTCGAHGESDLWPCDEVIDDAQSWADRDDMPAELRLP